MARVLVIDDEENIRRSLKLALDRRGHDTVTAENCRQGEEFATAGFDMIFLDVMLPDGSGLDLLKKFLSRDKEQMIVMISGHADVDMAVDAIRNGAYDFIEKPVSLDRLLVTLDNATRTSDLISEKERLSSLIYGDFIGQADSIMRLKKDVMKSAPKTSHFLILGENGTGKELIAHMIHRRSKFADGPFVAVNCAALPSELVEAELFGHTSGAFTGAGKARRGRFVEASGGSIFLDEISEMPLSAQAKILRVVETHILTPVGSDKTVTIEGNIIAASNRDLEKMTSEGTFRRDLLYRLNVVQFDLPSLRQRPEDIPLLAEHFLKRFASETKTEPKRLSDDALTALNRFDFPGNTRQLKNLMERANIYCDNAIVELSDLQPMLPAAGELPVSRLKDAVAAFEDEFITNAIARNDGNIAKTARELGVERSHLYKKIKKHQS